MEFILLKAGIPWEVLASASEDRIVRYYAAAMTEQELETEALSAMTQATPQAAL